MANTRKVVANTNDSKTVVANTRISQLPNDFFFVFEEDRQQVLINFVNNMQDFLDTKQIVTEKKGKDIKTTALSALNDGDVKNAIELTTDIDFSAKTATYQLAIKGPKNPLAHAIIRNMAELIFKLLLDFYFEIKEKNLPENTQFNLSSALRSIMLMQETLTLALASSHLKDFHLKIKDVLTKNQGVLNKYFDSRQLIIELYKYASEKSKACAAKPPLFKKENPLLWLKKNVYLLSPLINGHINETLLKTQADINSTSPKPGYTATS